VRTLAITALVSFVLSFEIYREGSFASLSTVFGTVSEMRTFVADNTVVLPGVAANVSAGRQTVPGVVALRPGAKIVACLVSYPKLHDYLAVEAMELLRWRHPVDVLLYSDIEANISVGGLNMSTVAIPAIHPKLCRYCINLGDNKFLGAILHANTTRHGFDWLLVGDDDTTFYVDTVMRAIGKLDPSQPHLIGAGIDRPESAHKPNTTMYPTEKFKSYLNNCPPLGPPGEMRLVSIWNHKGKDYTAVKKDCNATKLENDQLVPWGWPHGGEGTIISRGLLDSITMESFQKCIDRIIARGSDIRVSACLASFGFLPREIKFSKGCRLTSHKLGVDSVSKVIRKHKAGCWRGLPLPPEYQ